MSQLNKTLLAFGLAATSLLSSCNESYKKQMENRQRMRVNATDSGIVLTRVEASKDGDTLTLYYDRYNDCDDLKSSFFESNKKIPEVVRYHYDKKGEVTFFHTLEKNGSVGDLTYSLCDIERHELMPVSFEVLDDSSKSEFEKISPYSRWHRLPQP